MRRLCFGMHARPELQYTLTAHNAIWTLEWCDRS